MDHRRKGGGPHLQHRQGPDQQGVVGGDAELKLIPARNTQLSAFTGISNSKRIPGQKNDEQSIKATGQLDPGWH